MKKITWLCFLAVLIGQQACSPEQKQSTGPTPLDSLALYREIFQPPEKCKSCHPTHYEEWKTSMHAYAFVDPVFFRLNEIGQQRSGNRLDQFCVKCHSPFATLLREAPPGFDPANMSPLAAAGVHCDVCHNIKQFQPGKSVQQFYLDRVRRGPIADPMDNPFHQSDFDGRYQQSEICSPCHNVIAPNGLLVEATNQEWDESPYQAMGVECQTCHMPVYQGQAAVGGPVRDNLHRHYFVGVDIPLVDFPGKDQTIQQVAELLRNAVQFTLEVPSTLTSNQPLVATVTILNDRTGHHIPTGTIFERQMWVEFTVTDLSTGAVLYQSGQLDPNGDLLNHHSEYVANGTLPADTALALFHGIPYTQGEETLFFWEADYVEKKTIPPFDSRSVEYRLPAPLPVGNLLVKARLRFRSFPPYLLREIGQEDLLPNLIIFDMAEQQKTVQVTG